MSEPQLKQALLRACEDFFSGKIYAADAQAIISQAITENEDQISKLKIEHNSIKCACDFAELACDRKDQRIKELEGALLHEQAMRGLVEVHRDEYADRLYKVEEILERVPHSRFTTQTTCERNPNDIDGCCTDCLRCAYDKLLLGWNWKEAGK